MGALRALVETTTITQVGFKLSEVADMEEGGSKAPIHSGTVPEIVDSMMPQKPELPVGGRFQYFYDRWTKITSDKSILDIV